MDARLAHDLQLLYDKDISHDDEEELLGYLRHVGYHRLSIYTVDAGDFADVKRKYIFDKRLRILFLDMLEVIENSVKSVMCYHLGSQFDSHTWYVEPEVYADRFAEKRLQYITDTTGTLRKHDVTTKKYFSNNPDADHLPEYIFLDKLTFGELIYMFRDLKTTYKKEISNYYGINYKLFENWIDCLRYLRNLCSHYEPVYFRKMLYAVKGYARDDTIGRRNACASYMLLISLFEKILMPNYSWSDKVFGLMEKFDIT